MKFNKPDVQVFLGRVVRPGTHRRRAAIATLLTLLAIPRMAGRRRLHSPGDCAARPQAVGRRRFACAGGTSAIRFIEHVAPHVHPAPCHYMLGDPHQQATARWTHEGVVDQATGSGTGLGWGWMGPCGCQEQGNRNLSGGERSIGGGGLLPPE